MIIKEIIWLKENTDKEIREADKASFFAYENSYGQMRLTTFHYQKDIDTVLINGEAMMVGSSYHWVSKIAEELGEYLKEYL